MTSRYLNTGQSCIAAKRFVLVRDIADDFLALFRQRAQALVLGDPMQEQTQLGPMARADLRESLHTQVGDSIRAGAEPVLGCAPIVGPGYFYPASVLDRVQPGMRAYSEELFGPVAIVLRARDEEDALRLATTTLWARRLGVDAIRARASVARARSSPARVSSTAWSKRPACRSAASVFGLRARLALHGIRDCQRQDIWIK